MSGVPGPVIQSMLAMAAVFIVAVILGYRPGASVAGWFELSAPRGSE